MSTEENIRLFYPLPLAKVYEAMRLESEPRLRVNKFVEFYEELLRYLGLLGLASYEHYGMPSEKVEAVREQLARPTLGIWFKLAVVTAKAIRSQDRGFLQPKLGRKYKDGEAIFQATQEVRSLLEDKKLKAITLNDFLSCLLKFRNEKVGHGGLAVAEARHILPYLTNGLNQWLDALTPLKERHLIYVDRVEFLDPNYLYRGINLNSGTSLDPLRLEAAGTITPRQLYWHIVDQDRFIPLQPYLAYNRDTQLVYLYRHLSADGQPELICSYEQPGPYQQIALSSRAGERITKPKQKQATEPPKPVKETRKPKRKATSAMHNWFDIITPHKDIRKGHFDEAVFAADLGDVYAGTAADDYNDPFLFFKKTYLTAGLEGLLRKVHAKLTEGQGASVIQIQTPFGGGKTHALVAIYHYLKNGKRISALLPSGLDIQLPKLSVISGDHWNPLEGQTSDGVTRYTFWGEMAYQVGGPAGYEILRANDEARVSPGKDDLREFLESHQPFVLLFDEILEYINRAQDVRAHSEVSLGTQTFSFFQELTETVASLPNGMLVVTLPSSHLEDFGDREEESLARLGKIFGRLETIETPVQGEEVYAVIRRRLFEVETLKNQPMREIVHKYFNTYQQHLGDMPPKARDVNYRDKMELAYPFHPDVIDILYEKWSTFSSFQRTRGVLRLLANVVEDLYQRETNVDLILPGDINLDRPSIRQEFLKHIGSEYEGVIGSDIAGHEAKAQALDKANKQWKHLSQRISTATFFHSFTAAESEKGISLPYIKLAVLRSDTIPALVTDVLQKLGNSLWYLNSRGETYFFSRIPNLNRMILDKKELFNESYEEPLEKVIKDELGRRFRNYLWPRQSEDIPDNRELKLIILHPHDSGSEIPQWIERRGQSFREYKGTLYFALAEAAAFAQLRDDVKTYLALVEIEAEINDDPDTPLKAKAPEIQNRKLGIERDYSWKVRRMYHVLQVGDRRIDLGQPVAGRETLDGWFWRELSSSDVGAIVEQLHYRMIVNRLMAGNEQVATGVILDQFYKNPELPAPASPEVVARAIQLGVQEGGLGLAISEDGDIKPESLSFNQMVPLNVISFEPGIYVISRAMCEELLQETEQATDGEEQPIGEGVIVTPGGESTGIDTGGEIIDVAAPGTETKGGQKFNRVRLVIGDVPASRIADVNRGIFLPLSASVDNLKFTLEIDVTSDEGISQSTLENKIKETISQIGATLVDESVD